MGAEDKEGGTSLLFCLSEGGGRRTRRRDRTTALIRVTETARFFVFGFVLFFLRLFKHGFAISVEKCRKITGARKKQQQPMP